LAARAIENQMFFVGCNRIGASKGEVFGGHSMIVSPWGEILTEGDDRQTLLVTQIDLAQIDDAREKVPVFRDRRGDVYSRWRIDRDDA
jgi:omega-amidase